MNDAKFGIFFTVKKHVVPHYVVLVLMFSNDMIYLRPCHGQTFVTARSIVNVLFVRLFSSSKGFCIKDYIKEIYNGINCKIL